MDYSIILNLHVTADIIWIVSMLVISISVAASVGYAPSADSVGFNRMRVVNRFITTPFMILAWILGITLAVKGAWFGANWLSAKLVFVLVLSAVHGVQTKTLRRLAASPETKISLIVRLFPVIVVLCGLIIVWLALTKPF
jgi:putative membrane protein